MNKQEWVPVNPCNDCDLEDKERREHRYGFNNECQCNDLHCYFQEVYYQKKLLEYLIKYAHHAKLMTVEVVMKQKLEDMLKTLTMDKSMGEVTDGKLIDRGSFAKYVEEKNGQ
jgi:hypothetical protein